MFFSRNGLLYSSLLYYSLAASLVIVIVLMSGCQDNPSRFQDTKSSEPLDLSVQKSRVFDGRDSVATGGEDLVATQTNFSVVTDFLLIRETVDGGGEIGFFFTEITDPSNLDPATALFESREQKPIPGRDGEQITWGEFGGAEGSVFVKCTDKGTHTTTHLSGLVPKGFYSVWIDIFEPDSDGRIARLEYKEYDDKGNSRRSNRGNVIRASAGGEAHISGFVLPTTIEDTEISNCMLNDVDMGKYDWQVLGIYHFGDEVDLSREGTFVEQTAQIFENEESDSPPVIE